MEPYELYKLKEKWFKAGSNMTLEELEQLLNLILNQIKIVNKPEDKK